MAEIGAESPRVGHSGWRPERRLMRMGLLVLLAGVAGVSAYRASELRFDFHHFYGDAAYVWQHGRLNPDMDNADPVLRRQLPFYLPVVSLLLAPLAAGGLPLAVLLWAGTQTWAVAASILALARWQGGDSHGMEADLDDAGEPYDARGLMLACVLALPAIFEAVKFNQLSFVVLAVVLAAFAALQRKKPKTAGVLFAFATILKLLPGIFLLWLLLKRKWASAGAFVVAATAFAILPCLLVFGPTETLAYHRQWLDYNVRGAPGRGMTDPELREHFVDHRNQSIAAVVARWAWPEHPYRLAYQPVAWDREMCGRVTVGVEIALLAGLAWATRRSWKRLGNSARHGEFATYVMAMLVFSPLLRQYYLVWALPALVLLCEALLRGSAPWARRVGAGGAVLWVLSLVAWLWEPARAGGATLAMLIVLGALVMILGRERAVALKPADSASGGC